MTLYRGVWVQDVAMATETFVWVGHNTLTEPLPSSRHLHVSPSLKRLGVLPVLLPPGWYATPLLGYPQDYILAFYHFGFFSQDSNSLFLQRIPIYYRKLVIIFKYLRGKFNYLPGWLTYCCFILLQCQVISTQWNTVYYSCDIFKAVNPLFTFWPLSSNIKQSTTKRQENKFKIQFQIKTLWANLYWAQEIFHKHT